MAFGGVENLRFLFVGDGVRGVGVCFLADVDGDGVGDGGVDGRSGS